MANNALTFRMRADLDPAKRSIESFTKTAAASMAVLGSASVMAARNMEQMSGASARAIDMASRGIGIYSRYKIAMLGIAVGASAFAAGVAVATAAVARLNEIASGSRASGVDSSIFQVWERQADSLRLKTEDMRAALVKMRETTQPGVDETGNRKSNSVVDMVRDSQNISGVTGGQLDIIANAQSAQQRFLAILEVIRAIHVEAQRVGNEDLKLWADRLSSEAFGSTAAKAISDAVAQGKLRMDELAAAAKATGSIFSEDLVNRADDLSQKVKEAGNRISDEMRPAVEVLAGLLLEQTELWVKIANGIANALAWVKSFGTGVEQAAQGLKWLLDHTPLLAGANALSRLPGAVRATVNQFSGAEGAVGEAVGGAAVRELTIRGGRGVNSRVGKPETGKAGRSGRAAATDTYDGVDAFLTQMEKSIKLLEAEAAGLGKSATEKERLLAITKAQTAAQEDYDAGRRTSATLTDEEIKKAEALAAKKAALTETIKRQKEAEEGLKEATSYFGNQLLDAFDAIAMRGENAQQVIENLARSLAKAALQAMLLGEGSLAGILGTKGGGILSMLLGSFSKSGPTPVVGAAGGMAVPTFADGGYLGAGKIGIAGEAGPEFIMGPANIISTRQSAAILSSARSRGAQDFSSHVHVGSAVTPQDILSAANAAAAKMAAAARRGAFADVHDYGRRYG